VAKNYPYLITAGYEENSLYTVSQKTVPRLFFE